MLCFLISRLSASHICKRRTRLGFLHHNAFHVFRSVASIVKLSDSNHRKQNQQGDESFTVSYLRNFCGLPPKVAVQESKRVHLINAENPNSVLDLFRSSGFSETQISKLVEKDPRVLLADPENTLLPKLRFFQSIGFSRSELPEFLISNYRLLTSSLKKRIIPRYEALKRVLDNDNEKVIMALKCTRWIFVQQDVTNLTPNIKVLREHGVPQSSVTRFVTNFSSLAFIDPAKFAEDVKFVKATGIEPFRLTFLQAVYVVSVIKKSTWESKLDMFERCGWSRDVTLAVFRKFPYCTGLSEEKITNSMKLFVDEMGLSLDYIAKYPSLLGYSLKQRIIPRWSVVKTLKMNGLLKKNMPPRVTIFNSSEEEFLEKFVVRFQENVPQLLNIYKDSISSVPEVQ